MIQSSNPPLISVVVPSYNYANFITSALESILAQTYPNLELVIVDDASRDASVELIQEYLAEQRVIERFHSVSLHVHEQNQGAHITLNEGIVAAKGDLLAIINADDLYEPERFSRMYAAMGSSNAEFAFSNVRVIDEACQIISATSRLAQQILQPLRNIETYPSVGFSLLPSNAGISTGNYLFTRSIWQKAGPFQDLRYCHDWAFILQALLHTEPCYVPDTHYLYRLHGTNTIRGIEAKAAKRESHAALYAYFFAVRAGLYENQSAPGPDTWPCLFERFLHTHHLWHYWKETCR